jgi:DNA-binding NarL/FixJ family response regulator
VRERLAEQVSEVPLVEIVGLATDGPTAMRLFHERHPDVVVLDIEMPGMSGLDVLTYIKRQRPSCVAIMLSNHASGSFRLGCDRLGADFFFNKSNEFERITDVLKAINCAQTLSA